MALALRQAVEFATTPALAGPVMPHPVLRPRRPLDEDDLLIERIARGEEAAFAALVERHVDRAYALALRILRNPADAEDVAQDVMLKIWIQRGNWETGKARFSTWLYRVVTNRCLDICRRPKTEVMAAAADPSDGAPDALTTVHRSEVSVLLESAMRKLPEQQRIAVILSYTDDLKNAEIADIMQTSVTAVESLLKRGRQQLRHHLRSCETDIRASLRTENLIDG